MLIIHNNYMKHFNSSFKSAKDNSYNMKVIVIKR